MPPTTNVLFLCTGNSARSIMAEAMLNSLPDNRRFRAFSAGSRPTGRVHPAALHRLQQAGHSIAGLRSKSWDEFSAADGPVMDIVITVCDSAASESCPLWRGAPLMSHWGMPDPAAAVSDTERAFDDAYHLLRRRIDLLVALPLSGLDEASLQVRLDDIADAQA